MTKSLLKENEDMITEIKIKVGVYKFIFYLNKTYIIEYDDILCNS